MFRTDLLSVSIATVTLFSLARVWDPYPGDLAVARYIQGLDAPGLLWTMEFVSVLGEIAPMFALTLFVMLLLWITRKRATTVAGMLVLISVSSTPLLKLLVGRERPAPERLLRATEDFPGLGFPSGHVLQSALILGFIIYAVSISVERRWLKLPVQVALASLIVASGTSRIYIGAHWPSDVLGGYAAAISLGLAVYLYHERAARFATRGSSG